MSNARTAAYCQRVDLEMLLGCDSSLPSRLKMAALAAVAVHAVLFFVHFPGAVPNRIIVSPPPQGPHIKNIHFILPPEIPDPPRSPERPLDTILHVPKMAPETPEPVRAEASLESMQAPPFPGAWHDTVMGPSLPSGMPGANRIIVDTEADIPARRIGGADPAYPAEARRLGLEDDVILLVTINANGDVVDVAVQQEALFGMTKAAVSAVRGWKYSPAIHHGRPIIVMKVETIRFRIRT
jgi:protein TonB